MSLYDISYGVIAVDERIPERFLLIQHNAGHWAFPKGHKEGSESDQEAALREFSEETGILGITLYDGFSFSENYSFPIDGEICNKTVIYFLGLVHEYNVTIQKKEIQSYKWATYEEALALITFSEAREVLKKAQEYLNMVK